MARKPCRRGASGKFNYVNRWIKYLLCITNFYFMIAGCLFFVLGVIAFMESGILNRKSSISLLQWLFNLTVLVFGIGFITMCVAFTGFIGSLRENQCLLKFYYISLALLFVCETIIGIVFFIYRESAINRIEDIVKKTFISQYREIGFEDSTNFVDFIQIELQCCGAKSYNDWTENRYFSCNSTNISSKACGVPYSCCKRMNNINPMPTLPGFTKRFSLPKMPARKAASMSNLSQLDASTRNNEFGLDYGVVKARLSGRNLIFKNGRWRVEEGRGDTVDEGLSKEATQLRSENRKLYEENNLLKIKVEILLDMLTETTAEVQLQENEIESLRSLIHRKSFSSYSHPAMSAT